MTKERPKLEEIVTMGKPSTFVIGASFVIRHSTFVIPHFTPVELASAI
ncbi:MAG TPA: hypothetical protein VGM54_04040 [Chthoniobacter sp.]